MCQNKVVRVITRIYGRKIESGGSNLLKLELGTYILIGHVPIWPFSIGHHLPHDDAVTPHVTG